MKNGLRCCAGVSLAAGVLFGIIVVLLRQVGLFLTGFLAGLLLAVAAIVGISYFGVLDLTTLRVAGSLLGAAIFCALLNLYFSRGNLVRKVAKPMQHGPLSAAVT